MRTAQSCRICGRVVAVDWAVDASVSGTEIDLMRTVGAVSPTGLSLIRDPTNIN